jgi:ATP-dependent Zn protease
LVNESALYAAKNDRDYLTWDDFEYSLEKVVA